MQSKEASIAEMQRFVDSSIAMVFSCWYVTWIQPFHPNRRLQQQGCKPAPISWLGTVGYSTTFIFPCLFFPFQLATLKSIVILQNMRLP